MRRIKGLKINCHFEQNVILNLFQDLRFKRFRNKFGMTFRLAFTLAEVLITLTIIGVIAALTIPNLMQKWQDQHTVSAVKEAYSILNNALKMAIAENGSIEDWDWPNTSNAQTKALFFGGEIAKHLKIQKYCGNAIGCFNYGYNLHYDGVGYAKTLSGTAGAALQGNDVSARMILKNGMRVKIAGVNLNNADSWGSVFVDINGSSQPNRLGYDIFTFGINQNKLLPQLNASWTKYDYCKVNGKYAGDTSRDGAACAYWVLRKGNMDYKYRDVSAEW